MHNTHIQGNIDHVRDRMNRAAARAGRKGAEVLLCAVCKGRDSAMVAHTAAFAVDCFGENRVQEMLVHAQDGVYLDKPCHFIGRLQSNKVKRVVGPAGLIHGVDSVRLMQAIDREAREQHLVQNILIQVNVGREDSKNGVYEEALWPLLEGAVTLTHLRLRGLMAIPPAGLPGDLSRPFFSRMRELMERAQAQGFPMDTLSMGMSDSFEAAIEEGATIVRVGRGIFDVPDGPVQPL